MFYFIKCVWNYKNKSEFNLWKINLIYKRKRFQTKIKNLFCGEKI